MMLILNLQNYFKATETECTFLRYFILRKWNLQSETLLAVYLSYNIRSLLALRQGSPSTLQEISNLSQTFSIFPPTPLPLTTAAPATPPPH